MGDEDLGYLDSDDNRYKGFFDACGSHNKNKYPAFEVILTYYKKRIKKLTAATLSKFKKEEISEFLINYEIDYQEHFEFVRTINGYKLLSASIKN